LKNNLKNLIKNKVVIGLFIFFFSFFAFTGTMCFFYTTDSLPNNFTALNIIFNKRLDLDNYHKALGRLEPFITIKNNKGVIFAKTPPLMGILTVPTFWVLNKYYGVKYLTEEQIVNTDYSQLIGKLSASFYCSLSSVLMFFILLKVSKNKWRAFLMTLVYFLCTNIFNTASQANFQHGISLFLINLFLLVFISGPKRLLNLIVCGLIAGLFTQVRISNGFYVVFILSYFGLYERRVDRIIKRLFPFLIGFITTYGSILAMNVYFQVPNGYFGEFVTTILEFDYWQFTKNALALLFSFNFGLFFFSPILLLGFPVLSKFNKINTANFQKRIILSLLPTLFIYIIFTSSWWAWTGGRSLNARLITESMPIYIVLLGFSYKAYITNRFFKIIFTLFFLVSLSINILTTYFMDRTMRWYDTYIYNGSYRAHIHQVTSAWFAQPMHFKYLLSFRLLRIVKLTKEGSKLIIHETIYRPSLRYLHLRKMSESKNVMLKL
jgi:hypothetical protein